MKLNYIICQKELHKFKYIFHEMKELAKEHDIKWVWFYGERGHGGGLVDFMPCFWCKQYLKHVILTEDLWFDNAQQMVDFITQYFEGDNSKEYHFVDAAQIAEVWKKDAPCFETM